MFSKKSKLNNKQAPGLLGVFKRLYHRRLQLLLLVVALYILLNNNIYPGMKFVESEQLPSPYGVSFLERYRETTKNYFAENVLLPRPRSRLPRAALVQANQAWQYFINNTDPSTGLVNTVDGYSIAGAWDIASQLAAMHSAHKLELIDKQGFDRRLQPLLHTLLQIKLLADQVPNRYYNTKTGKMVGYTNKEGGVGYSPIDLGRLLGWLYFYKQHYPEYASDIDKVALRWNYCNLIDGGEMFGGVVGRGGKLSVSQQGRLGYEEYAAKGFYLWGFDTSIASQVVPFESLEVAGIEIPVDKRDLLNPLEKSFVVPDSYLLDGLEYHWDAPDDFHTSATVYSDNFAYSTASKIYQVQRKRFEASGIPTARSEIQLPVPPHFVYNSIIANGKPWLTIDDKGLELESYATLSTRAAFSMWALWDTPYTALLYSRVANLYKEGKGYYEGVYETGSVVESQTANANSVVLSSLSLVANGKPHISSSSVGLWEFVLKNAIKKRANPSCYPIEHVCQQNCDAIASFNTNGIRSRELREIEAKLDKLEDSRAQILKPFETVQ